MLDIKPDKPFGKCTHHHIYKFIKKILHLCD